MHKFLLTLAFLLSSPLAMAVSPYFYSTATAWPEWTSTR